MMKLFDGARARNMNTRCYCHDIPDSEIRMYFKIPLIKWKWQQKYRSCLPSSITGLIFPYYIWRTISDHNTMHCLYSIQECQVLCPAISNVVNPCLNTFIHQNFRLFYFQSRRNELGDDANSPSGLGETLLIETRSFASLRPRIPSPLPSESNRLLWVPP